MRVSKAEDAALRSDAALWLIGAFKIVKGTILVLLALVVHRLLAEGDFSASIHALAFELHLRPEGRLVGRTLSRIGDINPATLRHASAGILVYAALLYTEGVGLVLRQRWAEYLTVVMTGVFVPFEVYEILQHATLTRFVILLANVAIVVYLVLRLRRERRTR